jgi:hypothetical protein
MNTIEYWVVEETWDRDSRFIGNFSSEAVAEEIATGTNKQYRGVFRKALTIFDSVEDFENNTSAKIRERALAKLTLEERLVLGLK